MQISEHESHLKQSWMVLLFKNSELNVAFLNFHDKLKESMTIFTTILLSRNAEYQDQRAINVYIQSEVSKPSTESIRKHA